MVRQNTCGQYMERTRQQRETSRDRRSERSSCRWCQCKREVGGEVNDMKEERRAALPQLLQSPSACSGLEALVRWFAKHWAFTYGRNCIQRTAYGTEIRVWILCRDYEATRLPSTGKRTGGLFTLVRTQLSENAPELTLLNNNTKSVSPDSHSQSEHVMFLGFAPIFLLHESFTFCYIL